MKQKPLEFAGERVHLAWPGCPRHGDCQACKACHHLRGEKTACEKKQGTRSDGPNG